MGCSRKDQIRVLRCKKRFFLKIEIIYIIYLLTFKKVKIIQIKKSRKWIFYNIYLKEKKHKCFEIIYQDNVVNWLV